MLGALEMERHKRKQMIFKEHKYPQHVPERLRCCMQSTDSLLWRDMQMFVNTSIIPPKLHFQYLNVGIRDSLHAAMLLCVVHSFSLLHTYFGRENRGAVCPLQAGSRSLSSIINLAGTESTNICFD